MEYNMKFGLNTRFEDKKLLSHNNNEYRQFRTVEGTLDDLKSYILKGWAHTSGIYKGGIRSKNNFISTSMVALDFDKGFKLEELLSLPLVRDFGRLYTSASYTEDKPRVRLIFVLENLVTDHKVFKELIRLLAEKTGANADENAKDAARLWYGNTNAKFINWTKEINYLPSSYIRTAEERVKELERQEKIKLEEIKKRREQFFAQSDITKNEIETAIDNILRKLPVRKQGTNTYQIYLNLGTAIKNELGLSEAAYKISAIAPKEDWYRLLKTTNSPISFEGFISQAKVLGYTWDKNDFPWSGRYKKQDWNENLWYKDVETEGEIIAKGDIAKRYAEIQLKKAKIESILRQAENDLNHKPFTAVKTLEKLEEKNIFYVSDRYSVLPLYSKYKGKDKEELPIIKFKTNISAEEKAGYIQRLYTEGGWKYIHDKSTVGSGKSHMVKAFNDTIYLDREYKNPSVESLKTDFVEITARIGSGKYKNIKNGDIRIDPDFTKENKEDWQLIEPANCIRANWFTTLAKKNFNLTEGSELSPCKGCPWNQKDDQGNTYCHTHGYFAQKNYSISKVKELGKGRAHFSQISKKYEKSFSNYTAIWEEGGVTQDISSVIIPKSDISMLVRVIRNNLELPKQLKDSLLLAIEKVEDFYIYKTKLVEQLLGSMPFKFFGLTDNIIRPYIFKDNEFNYEELLPELFNFETNSATQIVKDFNDLQGIDTRIFKEDVSEETKLKQLQYLEDQWVYSFLQALCKKNAIFSLDSKFNVILHTKNDRRAKLAKLFKANVFLDATISTKALKAKYNITEDVLEVSTITPEMKNLTITHINISGFGSKNLSKQAINNANSLISKIKEYNPQKKVGVLTHKTLKNQFNTDYYFGNHDRGTNLFKEHDILILSGLSRRNVNDITTEYLLNYPDISGFSDYYQELIYEDLIQASGRLRAQHRPNDKLSIFLFDSKDTDLSPLQNEFSCKIEYLNAWQLDPSLLSSEQKYIYFCSHLATTHQDKEQKITQKDIAEAIGVSQGRVSQIQKEFYGLMGGIRKLLVDLNNISTSTNNNTHSKLSKTLTQDTKTLYQSFLNTSSFLRQGFDYAINFLLNSNSNPFTLISSILPGFISFTDNIPELYRYKTSKVTFWTHFYILTSVYSLIPQYLSSLPLTSPHFYSLC